MSWNILCDRFCNEKFFTGVPDMEMLWSYRWMLVKQVLQGEHKKHIICFQEMDKWDDVMSLMEPQGYKGIYKKRKGNDMTNSILYDSKRLELSHPEMHGNYVSGEQKYIIAQFYDKVNKTYFTVANTHLKAMGMHDKIRSE